MNAWPDDLLECMDCKKRYEFDLQACEEIPECPYCHSGRYRVVGPEDANKPSGAEV